MWFLGQLEMVISNGNAFYANTSNWIGSTVGRLNFELILTLEHELDNCFA